MTKNHELLNQFLEANHLKDAWLMEHLGRGRDWVSKLLNGHITVYALEDAVKINEITNGFVPVKGW